MRACKEIDLDCNVKFTIRRASNLVYRFPGRMEEYPLIFEGNNG